MTPLNCRELFGSSNTGINFKNYEDIPVDATGSDVPDPINDFAESSVSPSVVPRSPNPPPYCRTDRSLCVTALRDHS